MKDFVPPNEALELKHLGFDEPCFGYYDSKSTLTVSTNKTVVKDWVWIDNSLIPIDMTLAPLFSQAFRFFREKYNLNHEIPYAGREGEYHAFVQNYIYGNNGNSPSVFTYEEAELECLKKLIQIVKQKQ